MGWMQCGFISSKSLSGWADELDLRVRFWADWVKQGRPQSMWLAAFFFPKGMVSAVCQDYARSRRISIEEVDLSFEVLSFDGQNDATLPVLSEGCYVNGLFLDGCCWEDSMQSLIQLRPQDLPNPMPILWFRPCTSGQPQPSRWNSHEHIYTSPTYRVPRRRSCPCRNIDLQHQDVNSSIVDIGLPSKVDPEVWLLAGVALVLTLGS